MSRIWDLDSNRLATKSVKYFWFNSWDGRKIRDGNSRRDADVSEWRIKCFNFFTFRIAGNVNLLSCGQQCLLNLAYL